MTTLHRNPRRVVAEQSVSLRRGPPKNQTQNKAALQDTSQKTSDSSSPLNKQQSSGETSNADRWFEKSNRNVTHGRSFDNDSPFFLDNAAPDSPHRSSAQNQMRLPLRSQLAPFTSYGSSSEEYRSVIDDLTIANKKLKRRLAKYESSRDVHLKRERMFEVKIHGLNPRKRRELDETLQKFAAALNQSPTSDETGTQSGTLSGASRPQQPAAAKATSSMASTRFADSGYGSMTASGQNSTSHSGQVYPAAKNEVSQLRDRSIHSYLHDIPEGLLPRHSTAMTEKSKKKLVVRRLEQIFGGRGAAPGEHQHTLQQQEVSRSAERAERTSFGQARKLHGIREAKIMELETEDPMYLLPSKEKKEDEEMEEGNGSSPSSEQRPTRPLDLDPDRAQIPEDNIEYIRHLGFLHAEGDPQLFTAGGDWVYLNLLVNMAQLHTINVTTSFVTKAIKEYSKRLELSADGRKVRWRGDADSNQESGNSSSGAEPLLTPIPESGRKRATPADFDPTPGRATPKRATLSPTNKSLAYTPIFGHHHHSDDEDSDDSVMDDESHTTSMARGDATKLSSTLTNSGVRSATQRWEDGPIIYYRNAPFCLDLSGDNEITQRSYTGDGYITWTKHVVGIPFDALTLESEEPRDSVLRALARPPTINLSDAELDLNFPIKQDSPKHVTFAEPEDPIQLEASGIGGVKPGDNFTVSVLRQRRVVADGSSVSEVRTSTPVIFKSILTHHARHARSVKDRIMSERMAKLSPSPLPPASMHFFVPEDEEAIESDSESGSDSGDEVSGTGESSSHRQFTMHDIPTFAPSHHSPSPERSSEDESDSDDDSMSDGSVDFLASARAMLPDTIRAQEREYDAEVADRLAEEIPAGSSAATAGGGSGFASPVDAYAMEVDTHATAESVSS